MNKTEKKLLSIFSDLDGNEQDSILSFAQFLLEKAKQEGRLVVAEEPLEIPRPEEERVVAAIKRLSTAYPMVKKETMLNETATLMTAHMVQGRVAVEVIDELEILFQTRYEEFCQQRNPDNDKD
ncbi:MAG: Crp/Fnr family transcriptional regulator [Gammaproteobacteria bacterium]|nr:Crp/Fnr family transcriptional regulator [Gammaproteobacteria bacterium]